MALDAAAFINRLDETIARHAMLDHPFYRTWNEGGLSRETLQEYVKQYYAHVRFFPRYVSAAHAACDDIRVRQLLLENLIDEDQGESNHPELWLRFADGMGVDRDAVRNAALLAKTRESVARMVDLTRSEDFRDGLAALYAYESQVPLVARTKREGLKAFYGVAAPRAVEFFTVHEEADVEHSRVERELLAEHCRSDEEQARALSAAEKAAQALWHFLDGVHEAYGRGAAMPR
ncbi:MAG TPA: CADD family putative folate metabolism protein [Candidatus Krumholzibacteria bacterium]|nr:CADD family putative folate metabolism protein [Candidatus Krumholzibacteria bacterium]